MAVEGENLGTAAIYLTVDTTSMDAGIASAKTKLAGMSAEAEKQYTAMSASQRKVADSLVKQAELINKTTAERIAYNAQLKVGGALGDEIAAKAIANAQAIAGAQADATAAAQAADAAKAEMAAADDARYKQIAADAMAEVEARKAITAATMDQARANIALAESSAPKVGATRGAAQELGTLNAATVQQQIADYAALDAVMTKKVVTTEEVAAAEDALDRLQAAGMISNEQLAETFAALDIATASDTKALQENTVANIENAGAKTINSRTAYSISALLSDAASGQISRSKREIAAVANETGLLSKLFSPMGIAIGGAVAALALFGKEVYNREQDLLAFNKALGATGDFAGVTGLELQGMAAQVGEATGDYANATKAILALAQSGTVLGSSMQDMATTAVNMAELTGQSVDKVVKSLVQLQGDPTKAIAKAADEMGLLTTAQYNQIVETQQQQGATAAAALAMKDLSDASDSARQKLVDNAGWVTQAWEGFKNTLAEIGRQIGSIGAQESAAEQLASINKFINAQATPEEKAALQKHYQSQIDALQLQQRAEASIAAGQQLANQDKQKHDQALAEALNSTKQGDQGFVAQAAAINEKRYAALIGIVDPSIRDRINAAYDQQIRDAAKRANSQLPKAPSAGRTKRDPGVAALSTFESQVNTFTDRSVVDPSTDKALTAFDQNILKLNADFDKAIAKHANLTAASEAYRQGVAALNQTLAKQEAQEKAVTDAYGENLNRLLASKENAIQIQVASVGMGTKEAAQMKELNAITQQQVQADQKLNDQRAKGTLTQDQYNTELAKSDAYFAKLRTDTVTGYTQMDEAQSNWVNGALAAMTDWADQGMNVATQTKTLFTNAFNGLNTALTNFVTTGKLNFSSLVTSILTDLAKMEMRIAESQILKSILAMFAPSGLPIAQTYLAQGGESFAAAGVNWSPNASGGVYNSPSLSRYSNGVYDSPRFFTFANGGVFGEDGPEAIMPLSRGRDGKLGVKSQGGGNVININTNVVVDQNGARSSTSSGAGDAAARQLGAMMEAKAKEVVSRAVQPGGLLWRHGVGQAA